MRDPSHEVIGAGRSLRAAWCCGQRADRGIDGDLAEDRPDGGLDRQEPGLQDGQRPERAERLGPLGRAGSPAAGRPSRRDSRPCHGAGVTIGLALVAEQPQPQQLPDRGQERAGPARARRPVVVPQLDVHEDRVASARRSPAGGCHGAGRRHRLVDAVRLACRSPLHSQPVSVRRRAGAVGARRRVGHEPGLHQLGRARRRRRCGAAGLPGQVVDGQAGLGAAASSSSGISSAGVLNRLK